MGWFVIILELNDAYVKSTISSCTSECCYCLKITPKDIICIRYKQNVNTKYTDDKLCVLYEQILEMDKSVCG